MLTGLELTFMGVTRSNSGLFSFFNFCSLTCGKKRKGGRKKKEGKAGKKKSKRKGRKEEGIKKDRRQDK